MLDITLRILALVLLVGRYIYWEIEKQKAQKILPKTNRKQALIERLSWYFSWFVFLVVCVQLLGVQILPIVQGNIYVQIIGLGVLSLGTWICFIARRTLAENWVSGEEHQIKNGQKLVTTGVYSFIRHPIYLGLTLSLIGGEMVAQSYLYISLVAYFFWAYVQGKREESNFLRSHFGEEYKKYMKHTKMLIPFVL